MSKKNRTVFVTGGGTGGHLFPAVAICEIVKDAGADPILITDSRCKNFIPSDFPFQYHIIDVPRRKDIPKKWDFIKEYGKLVFNIMKMMHNNKSICTIGCGGYSSVPILLASLFSFKSIFLHEQNSVAGKANRIFVYLARKIFLTFLHTIKLPTFLEWKMVWTGMPLQKRHTPLFIRRELKKGEFSILVTGGSQGAAFFDEVITDAIKIFATSRPDIKVKIFQQVRSEEIEKIQEIYKSVGVDAEIRNFFHNIEEYYKKADLFIGRSGATTVAEVIEYNLPGIFIPYPHATDDHQFSNARNIIEFDAGLVFRQHEVTNNFLAKTLEKIATDSVRYDEVLVALNKMKLDTKKIISQEITKIIDK